MPLPSGFETKEEYATYMREYRKREREKLKRLKEWNDKLRELVLDTEMRLLEAGDDEKKKVEILERHMNYSRKLMEIYDKNWKPKQKSKLMLRV